MKRLAWQAGIGLGLLLTGFLLGTLIESRKENEHLSSVIRSLPYSLQAPALLQITRWRGWHNQRRRTGRHVVWRPAGPVDLKRSQARSYFVPLSLTSVNRRGFCVSQRVSFATAMGRLKTVTGGRILFILERDSQERP